MVGVNSEQKSVFHLASESQQGFCLARTTSTRYILSLCSLRNSWIPYLLFVDFERTFNSLDRNAMCDALSILAIAENMLRIIQSMYRDVKYRVPHHGNHGMEFNVASSVRQGSAS